MRKVAKPCNTFMTTTYNINDGVGWGIIQWTHFSRKSGLEIYAATKGTNYLGDLNTQLEFMYLELTTKNREFYDDWQKLLQSQNINDATWVIMAGYENPDDKTEGALRDRVDYAEAIKARYNN
ncbi:MAG: phage tail-type lysozyme domain-containing protein [Syntrophomonadaceae bacterium]|jgi:hypothetical protein|nr:phage tail-type lysozyme domain-containing protein [Syntrophomonadaceae bacterium]